MTTLAITKHTELETLTTSGQPSLQEVLNKKEVLSAKYLAKLLDDVCSTHVHEKQIMLSVTGCSDAVTFDVFVRKLEMIESYYQNHTSELTPIERLCGAECYERLREILISVNSQESQLSEFFSNAVLFLFPCCIPFADVQTSDLINVSSNDYMLRSLEATSFLTISHPKEGIRHLTRNGLLKFAEEKLQEESDPIEGQDLSETIGKCRALFEKLVIDF